MENYAMDPNSPGSPSMSDMRRRYPKDVQGVKDEWQALIRHQAHINEFINQQERELKQLRQEELGQAYNQKRHELIQAKEHELRLKQDEAYQVKAKTEQFRADMMREQENRSLLQQGLADSYSATISAKGQIEQLKKNVQLEEEKRMLEETKRRMEEAKHRELMKQEEYYQAFNEEIRRAQDKNQRLLDGKIQDKLDYRDQIRDNERRQILKEENYRNFFKLSVENQKKLMDLHAQNVLSPQLQKDMQLDNIVDRRVNEERERVLQNELNRIRNREEKTHEVGHSNKEKMDYQEHLKHLEKMDKQGKVQESLKQSMEYQEFLRNNKNQRLEQQRNYKDFLDKQKEEQMQRDLLNKMTKQEKQINFGDLQAYKGYDPKLFALVPGFINSKYQHPLGGTDFNRSPGKTMKGGLYADTLAQPDVNQQATNYQQDNYQSGPGPRYDAPPQVMSPSRAVQNGAGSNSNSPTKDRRYETQQHFQSTDGLASPQYARGYNSGANYSVPEPYRTMGELPNKSHNPITNPLPVNIQNPYIMKEVNHISAKRPYFANMASNNLLG